jgi:rhamnulokinase
VALDLGAESGRVIVGTVGEARLQLEEVHRFPTGVSQVGDSLHWDVLRFWEEIKEGLRKVAAVHGDGVSAIGVDTWGIDYALLDRRGRLVAMPYAYRDPRTNGVMEKALQVVDRWEIYRLSGGIQFMPINTLYQLYSMVLDEDPTLEIAQTFLMIPDLFVYWLTGQIGCDFTDATSTQCYDSKAGGWAQDLLAALSIPAHLFPETVSPGCVVGKLLPSLAEDTGLGRVPVVNVAGHDTASAVVAVPAAQQEFAWLSSGTWSLLGGVSQAPIVTRQALDFNFSSYGGAGGVFLPWKNIMGLWLVQECRRVWAASEAELSYDELTGMARAAHPFVAVIDPDDPSFLAPKDMPAAIAAYCRQTGQTVPETRGEMIRVVLESLALRYRWTLERLGVLQNRTFDCLHAVGGGTKNALLCQLTADALGLPVVAGPVEATALGNIAVQSVTMGELVSLDEARQLVRSSCDVVTYEPAERQGWHEAITLFDSLVA